MVDTQFTGLLRAFVSTRPADSHRHFITCLVAWAAKINTECEKHERSAYSPEWIKNW